MRPDATTRAGFAGPGRRGRPSPPALTGGESHQHQARGAIVDWLTVTWYPEPDEHVPATVMQLLHDSMRGLILEGLEVPGMFGYDRGLRVSAKVSGEAVHVARLDWGGSMHKGRARLDISGSGCARIDAWQDVADWIGRQWDYKLTRVDLAVDCLHGEYTVEDARDWYLSGDMTAGGRRPRHSTPGDWLDPQHGRTLEVGRRSNGKMLRCYEKGRQLGDTASPWTRWEVELRNIDRDLPLDVLSDPSRYFAGAYRCLERLLEVAAQKIRTHQAEGELSLGELVQYARTQYGALVHVLRAHLSVEDVLDAITRPGVPARLRDGGLLELIPSARLAAA